MSDDEYSYHYSDEESDMDDDGNNNGSDDNNEDDDDDDGFDYSSEEEMNVGDIEVQMENEYYNAKGDKDTDKDAALEQFENVIRIETTGGGGGDDDDGDGETKPYGKWSFKALKQSMKLRLKHKEYDEARVCYQRLLKCITNNDGEIAPSAVEKGVNGMLERVSILLFQNHNNHGSTAAAASSTQSSSSSKNTNSPQNLAWYVYDSTLSLFHPKNGSCPNERLWFKTNLKYGQLLYENHETSKLQIVIRDLLHSSKEDTNSNNHNHTTNSSSSSTNLMEIYALQIQLYSRQKDHKKLRDIYTRAMSVRGGIPHPRTIALIQELGGKMHMSSRNFEDANTAFFQAFKSYDEAGDVARLRCLKYLVMASMLHASSINPFDSQEVRPYKDDPEIVVMTNLVDAFHNNDIEKFERILSKNEGRIMDDEFIREYLGDLLRTIRMQVLQEVLRPYTRITIEAISKKLNGIPLGDVENLLVTAILDGKLDGRIDQVNGMLLKNTSDMNGGVSGGGGGTSEMETKEGGTTGGGGNGMNPSANDGNGFGADSDGNNTIPAWGENSVSVRTCAAMENLMEQLESVTMAVTASNSRMTGNNFYSLLQP